VGVVTEALAGGDLSRLEGLVSADCLAGLRHLDTPPEQRHLLVVRPDDVFFAFVPDLRDNDGAQRLLLGKGTGSGEESV
jgi:hypothetical protein